MATPITQRAATKYGSAPANQEVTVDAAGKNAAKFERMSPLKQSTEVPDPIVTTDMGQDEAGNAREVTKTTNYSQADSTIIPGGNETRIKTAADAGVPQEEVDAYNMKKYGTKNPTKEGLTNNTIETGNKLADTVVPGEIIATETKEVKDAMGGSPRK
jgi:hypothetical protein